MQTTRFLITGVGGQGTILASDVLAEVGLRLGYDAKKSDILGLAVRGGSVVSHIIWGGKVRAPMIDEGSADYYISFEWLEGLRRMAYTNPDTVILANDWAAFGFLQACAIRGVRIPDEFSIIGMDDSGNLCTLLKPTLSSVAMPFNRVSHFAACTLCDLIDGVGVHQRNTSSVVRIPGSLKQRDSIRTI